MIFEPVVAIGWKEPGPKGTAIQIFYTGDDVERAAEAADLALSTGQAAYVRIVRGAFPASSQLMAASGPTHCWQPPGPLIPAGSK